VEKLQVLDFFNFIYVNDFYSFDLTTWTWSIQTPHVSLGRVRIHYATGIYGNQWIFHSGDYGSCTTVLLVPSTAVYLLDKNDFFDGIIPAYAQGPFSKGAQLTCFENKCYHTGGMTGIECTNSQLVYLNNVYSYKPNNAYILQAES